MTLPNAVTQGMPFAHNGHGQLPLKREEVNVTDLDLRVIVPRLWDLIVTHNDPPKLFQRDDKLWLLKKNADDTHELVLVDHTLLRDVLSYVCLCIEKRNGPERIVIPPTPVVDNMLALIDKHIPIIDRIEHVPVFVAGGVLIDTKGYHKDAKIYYDPTPGLVIPPVADHPTIDDVRRAKALIDDNVLVDFPFVKDDQGRSADRAHWWALAIRPFCYDMINAPTPLHAFDSSTPGTGKGLCADAALMPYNSERQATTSLPCRDEELAKKFVSMLRRRASVVLFDNVNHPINSGLLSSVLTSGKYSERKLGMNEDPSFDVKLAMVVTGNNLMFSKEIARRVVRTRLDAKMEMPQLREGFKHPDLPGWINKNRGDLIWAILTIIRYGIQHKCRPKTILGSYERWSEVIGGILEAAEIPDFLGNIIDVYHESDTESEAWRALVGAWYDAHGTQPVQSKDLFALVEEHGIDLPIKGDTEAARRRSFGILLASKRDNVLSIGGKGNEAYLRIEHAGKIHNAQAWKLVVSTPSDDGKSAIDPTRTGPAIWHNGRHHQPVTVTGFDEIDDLGQFYKIEEGVGLAPVHEVEFVNG